MKVQVLSLEDDKIRFLVEKSNIAFVNSLRRTMISELPCMAIEDIFIFDNSSVIPDEILANRLGFVPLKTDLDNYVLPHDCDCGSELGCSKCRVLLTLDVKAETSNKTVYSGDLVSEDPGVVPVNMKIPLTKLAPGQAVRIEAYAQLGQGKTHAKWQPVSMAVYQHAARIEVDKDRCTLCGECVEACPRSILAIEKDELRVVDLYACILCEECVKACPVEPSAIKQDLNSDSFLLTVESTGCLPPERVVSEAARLLLAKLEEFSGKIERDETDEEITEHQADEQEATRIYSVGVGDFDNEEDEENIDES